MAADASTGDLIVTYGVDTDTANATYPLTIELYLADEATGAQGETPLGLSEYTAGDYADCGSAPCTATVNLGAFADLGLTARSQIVATATDADGNTSEFSAGSAIAGLVDLEVTVVESADPVTPGSGAGDLVYTVTVTNDALSEATGVALESSQILPAHVFVVSQSPSTGSFSGSTWTLGDLAAGASETLTVTLTVPSSAATGVDAVTNTASVTAVDQTDTDTSNDTASESTSTVRRVDLDVSVAESADPVDAGSDTGNLIYTVSVTNSGPSDASGVTLSNALTLPTGVTADSQVPSAGSFSGTAWTLGALASGESETLTVTLTVGTSAAQGADVITDDAAVTAVSETDVDGTNDSASESTSIANAIDLALAMAETGGVSEVLLGGALTYELTATNNGGDAEDVVFTGTVPENTTFDSGSSSAGWQCLPDDSAGSTCTFAVGDLVNGAASSADFAVLVDDALPRDVTEIVNGASVGTAAGDGDATPADNTAEVTTDVDLPPVVQRVDTVSSTDDGELGDGEGPRAPVTQLLLELSEEVTGADAASSFLLVEAGDDGSFSSTCSGVSGDDASIAAESTVYDESGTYDFPTARLELGSGLPLQRGRYRLFACGAEIEDAAGQRLDGDLDGAVDGDFSLDFSVAESSLLQNPNFDRALAPWTSLDFSWDSDDRDDTPSSGSAESPAATLGTSTHPCIDVTTEEGGLYASLSTRIDDPGDVDPGVYLELEFYTEADCGGTSLSAEVLTWAIGSTGTEWTTPSLWGAIPATAVSARPRLVFESSDGSGSAEVDGVSLIPMLFGDGFESGDTGAWSATVP
ncbi:MAG: DUF11 domain-containing protein [Acidobacteriota bacterium]